MPAPSSDSVTAVDTLSVEAAAGVIRDYYAAIDAREFGRAYGAWGNDGAASGKTFQQFVAGFDSTARVTVRIELPGPMEGAAGSRYVDVPVVIRAVDTGGKEQWFRGSYVLRRAVVDGATAAQRRWHIGSARIRRWR